MEPSAWYRWYELEGTSGLQDLLRSWDPIGVAEEASDEYDGYVGRLAGQLRRGATTEHVLRYLTGARENMGLDPNPIEDRPVSERIHAWYVASTSNFAEPPSFGRPDGRAG